MMISSWKLQSER